MKDKLILYAMMLILGSHAFGMMDTLDQTGELVQEYLNPSDYKLKEKFAGKRVFLRDKMGLGDTMKLIQYAQLLNRAGATVVVETSKSLMQLLSKCPYIDELVSNESQAKQKFDIQIPFSCILNFSEETFEIKKLPSIFADPELFKYWKNKIEVPKNGKLDLSKPIIELLDGKSFSIN